MRPVWWQFGIFLGVAAASGLAAIDDPRRPGGPGSVADQTIHAFSRPFPEISQALRREFAVGNAFFRDVWVEAPSSTEGRDGLGPTYNAVSCASCHFLDGRGPGFSASGRVDPSLLFRLSQVGEGAIGPHSYYGEQLNPLAIGGVPAEGRVDVEFEEIRGVYADGSSYSLRRPVYRFVDLAQGPLEFPRDRFSPRVAPALFGAGLLEAVAQEEIFSREDPQDSDGNGISGRANRVRDLATGLETIGRFGWKAGQPNLRQQNAAAFLGDMGLTTSLFPAQNCPPGQAACAAAPTGGDPEVSDQILQRVTTYIQLLAVPERRRYDSPSVRLGEELFNRARCHLCHVPSLRTGDHPLPELSGLSIYPYTDLLLHDLGPGLADHRPEARANGREWKTPPLWGIGLVPVVNKHQNLLHDGRARGVAEAILWHGGEAQGSRDAFLKLPQAERDALVDFVNSL